METNTFQYQFMGLPTHNLSVYRYYLYVFTKLNFGHQTSLSVLVLTFLAHLCLPIFEQVGFSIDIIDNWVLTFLTIDMFPYFPKPWRHVRPFTICVLMQLPTKIITKYLSNPLKLPAVAGIPYLPIFLIFKGWTVPSTYFKGCHRNRWVFLTTDYWPFTAPLISNHFHHCKHPKPPAREAETLKK